jgi:hypothetical protein
MHPDVLPEEQRNAGGFKSGYNTDLYTRMNPKLGMTAANALAGHKNARKMVYPLTLESLVGLVDGNGLDHLESKLYVVSVPQFKPGGQLRPFLWTATAKLIMEHPNMIKDFGRNNKMVKKLVESMIKSKLALDPAEAAQKLNHWLNVIRNDYNQKNSLLPSAEDMTLLEIVQQQSVLINQLVLSNRNMEMQLEKQSGELAAVRETVENQSTSMVTALATSLIGALQGVWRGDVERVGLQELAEPGARTPSSMTTSNQQNPPEPPLSPSQQVEHSSQNDAVASFIDSIQGII